MSTPATRESLDRWIYALALDVRLSDVARAVGVAAYDGQGWIDPEAVAVTRGVDVAEIWAALDDLQALGYVDQFADGFIFRKWSGHAVIRRARQIKRRLDRLGVPQPAGSWGARVQ